MELLVNESWVEIPGFPGYRISTIGNIRGIKKQTNLRPIYDGTGRARVRITRDSIPYSFYVHDLLAIAFLGGLKRGLLATHINGNVKDNRIENIAFVPIEQLKVERYGEEWRDIVGYEGYYQVSSSGKVLTLPRTVNSPSGIRVIYGGLTRIAKGRGGYPCVYLSKDGVCRGLYVHRLVAEAFIPNPNNLPEINHKDESRTNNNAWNLEWCDHKYNMNYGTAIERAKESRRKNAKKQSTHLVR